MTTTDGDDRYTVEDGASTGQQLYDVWLLALATYGVGDVVTTIALVWFSPDFVEGNPLIATASSAFGGGGYLTIKLLVLFACLGVSLWVGYQDRDPLLFYGPPLLLAVVGTLLTAWNLWLIW